MTELLEPSPSLRLVGLESRRSSDMAGLLERAGFDVFSAPSMQEVPLSDQTEALSFADRLAEPDYDLLMLMTGVGFRMLLDVVTTRVSRAEVIAGLSQRPIACRGPKPVAVLKELGLQPAVVAPEPNTSQDLLATLENWGVLEGKRVVVQEYGQANPEFDEGLVARGATVEKLPVYAWALPDDLTPLQEAVRLISQGDVDGVVFTSQQQLQHLLEIARRENCESELLAALKTRVLVASIGPVTSEALRACDLSPDIEPAHSKMGHLAKALREQAQQALEKKRGALQSA